jgi:hypothetical protein
MTNEVYILIERIIQYQEYIANPNLTLVKDIILGLSHTLFC